MLNNTLVHDKFLAAGYHTKSVNNVNWNFKTMNLNFWIPPCFLDVEKPII